MAEVNQVVINGETKINLMNDTVTPADLSEGVTAHNAAGNIIVGTAVRGLPVGFEYMQTNPNIQTGSLPLIGGVYDRTIYADLWAWAQTQGPYLITESEWQALAEANGGAVPFYSDGDGSTTFRVPALTVYVKGTSSIDAIGDYLADTFASHKHNVSATTNSTGAHTHTRGTMNITGFEMSGRNQSLPNTVEGAFYGVENSDSKTIMVYNTTRASTGDYRQGFDASRSWTGETSSNGAHTHTVTISETAQGSEETRPKTIVGIYCVVAFGYVVSSGEVDLDSVSTLLADTQQAIQDAETSIEEQLAATNTTIDTKLADTEAACAEIIFNADLYTICSEATERAADAPTYGLA